jgi:cell division septal protein FtsQ
VEIRRGRRPVVYKRKNVVLRYKFKYERRQKAYKIGQFFAIICLVGFGLLFGYRVISNFLFCSDCFKIKTVEIRGAKNISASEIAALIPFRKGDNLFAAPVSETEENLRQCKPELKKLRVNRTWQGVVIRFEERIPVAFARAGGERLGLDDENKPFPLRGMFAKKIIPEIAAQDEAGRKDALNFIKVFSSKAKDVYPKIVKFIPEPVNNMSFELDSGMKVYWGDTSEEKIKAKLTKLSQVLFDAEERFKAVEYVNLCFFDNGRIIVKPKKANS